MQHPLDRPIRSSLTTRQRSLAEGDALALRYPADIAPFADINDESPSAYASLLRLIGPAGPVVLFTEEPLTPPGDFELLLAKTGEQMVATTIAPPSSGAPELVPLTAADMPAMMQLVELTKPGPFAARTNELGDFLGIFADGRLVAMAGERMKLDGYTEITAVCTHPDYRGRGYARILLEAVARGIEAHGEVPMLHVFSDNTSAIEVYRRSGFVIRRRLHVTVLARRR